ncbi:MAG: hypothetical protein LUF00_07740 [Lachnospiraceae bacterium]|nr:hypothetical protein [Lachnospiraceae bacterium]
MNKVEIENNLIIGKVMSRQDICNIAKNVDDTFRDTLLRNLIEELMSSGTITRIGRNSYIKMSETQNRKKIYSGMYSERAKELVQTMGEKFPLLNFQVWEMRWLNEFLNHLVGENIIFLDIEKDGCEFVYEELRDKYDGRLLLKPDAEQMYRYGKDGTIVIGRLVTEAPKGDAMASVPLERIMVELEANKVLRSLISTGEIPQIIRDMYDKYQVDSIKLLRYARRRNKKDIMMEVLGDRIMKK